MNDSGFERIAKVIGVKATKKLYKKLCKKYLKSKHTCGI